MREGWTYKKLGEVVVSSDLGKTLNQSKDTGTMHPYLCAVNILWDKIDLSTLKETRFEDFEIDRYTVSKGDLLICEGGDTGRAAIWDKEETILYQNALHRVRFKDEINPRYALYFLLHLKKIGEIDHRYSKGVTIKHLVKSSLLSIPLKYPLLSQQEAIVSELDEINSLLALKREQLQTYDKLAQSLFYEMFGDPVENEKGWEVNEFAEVIESATKGPFGSDIKKSLYVPKSDSAYKVYVQVNAISKDVSLGDYYISKEYFDQKMFKFEVKPGDYLITCDGTMGKFVRLPKGIERGIISASLLRLTLNDHINSCYFEYLWILFMLPYLLTQVRNAALQHLPSASKIAQVRIPLPPLPLQQQFATRIAQIEEQKKQVQAAIERLETLLASRMQYWFE